MELQRVFLEQGSAEWLAYRQTKRNASEAGAVMNCNPWFPKNQRELRKLKLGEKSVKVNDAMRDGTRYEQAARVQAGELYGVVYEPAVFSYGDYSASLDGITESGFFGLEVKVPHNIGGYEEINSTADLKEKKPHYYWQIVHQFWVVKTLTTVAFAVFDKGTEQIYYMVEVRRDDVVGDFDVLLAAWESFAKFVETGEQDADEEFAEAAREFITLTEQKKKLEDALKGLEEKLKSKGSIEACGVRVTEVEKKGAIDYGHKDIVKALDGIDLEKYRKKSTTYKKLEILK